MRHLPGEPHKLPGSRTSLAGYAARNFQFEVSRAVATITLNRPERRNPLTFESYAELRDLFRTLMVHADDVKSGGAERGGRKEFLLRAAKACMKWRYRATPPPEAG